MPEGGVISPHYLRGNTWGPLTTDFVSNRTMRGGHCAENLTSRRGAIEALRTPLMEHLGYILSEAPVFFLTMWFAIRLVHYRRYRRNQPLFSDSDRRLLFTPTKPRLDSPVFRLKLVRSILGVTAAMYVEILILGPFGAGILAAALLLTSAAIVHRILLVNS